MRAVIVSCVYPPEPVVSSRTSAELAAALASRGDAVTVIAPFPNRPEGRLFPGFARRLFSIESGNPRTVRCLGFFSRSSRVGSRLAENVSFGITSGIALLFLSKPDVIYANTWPIFAGGIVQIIAALRRIPVVLSVQDLYPESLIAQGRLASGGVVARAFRRIDRWIAGAARFVIVISERFAEIYRHSRQVSDQRLRVVPNWGGGVVVERTESSRRLRARLGLAPDERLLLFGGNIGVAAGAGHLVDAARLLRAEDRVRIVIAGSGTEVQRIRAMVAELADQRIVVYSPWPVEETSDLLGAADAFLLPTQGNQSMVSVPSKLISYFMAGRPVLAMALPGSDLAGMIERARGGWVVSPGDIAALTGAIRMVGTIPESELRERGRACQRFALDNLTTEVCLPRLIATIDSASGGRS